MKPCPNHREAIALLATNPSRSEGASATHSHLDQCGDCRQYFAEMASLHDSYLTAALNLPYAGVSTRIYRKVAAAIRIPVPSSVIGEQRFFDWRLPLATAAAVVVAALLMLRPATSPTLLTTIAAPSFDPDDTRLVNYSRALAQSPEALDSLLARSAARISASPETSILSWRNAPDYDL